MAPPAQKKRKGVALGALGVLLLSFFSIVFMMGRHHSSLHDVYEGVVHPFDPHPVGVDPLSRGGKIKTNTAATGGLVAGRKDAPGQQQQQQQQQQATNNTAEVQKPAEQKPAEQKPVEVKPAEQKPAEVKPTEQKPAEVKPAEQKPAEVKPAEVKPAEVKVEPPKEEPKALAKPRTDAEKAMDELHTKYTPSREMVQRIQQDGYLVVTWANWHYHDFVRTWVYHVKNVGITGYIVGAMDDHLLQWLVDQKDNCFSMRSGLTLGDFGWGSPTFAKMGREKIRLIAIFLRLGVDVVIADVDVLWLRNPIPYFKQYPDADVLTSSDHLENTVTTEALEIWPQAASAANIGIMLFRNKSLDFVDNWVDIINKDEKVWDQNAFNDLFRRGTKILPDDPHHLFLAYNQQLKMGILPVALFASGHTFFVQRLAERLGLKAYALHATFQFSGTNGKRHRMREFMLFDDLPSYYDHPKGFFTFSFDHMDALIANAGPRTGQMDLANTDGHFKLVNHQMQRTRTALAVATVLGRAVIMPPVWCGLDRWWGPHSGRIPGSKFPLPFQCPLDHVFDLEGGWGRDLDVHQHGPKIDFREYSFLNNTRTPASVKSNRVVIEVCPAGTTGCSDGAQPAPVEDGRIRIQEGLMDDKLRTALQNADKFKVLEFTTMANVFKNFTNPVDWTRFEARMRIYTSIWCCVMAHPGHIWYDMLWDVPHVDRFGRNWNSTWTPTCGP